MAIERCADEGIARAQRAGASLVETFAWQFKGRARLYGGDYRAAVELLEHALQVPDWNAGHSEPFSFVPLSFAKHLAGDDQSAASVIAPVLERRDNWMRYLGLVVTAVAGMGEATQAAARLAEAKAVSRQAHWRHSL